MSNVVNKQHQRIGIETYQLYAVNKNRLINLLILRCQLTHSSIVVASAPWNSEIFTPGQLEEIGQQWERKDHTSRLSDISLSEISNVMQANNTKTYTFSLSIATLGWWIEIMISHCSLEFARHPGHVRMLHWWFTFEKSIQFWSYLSWNLSSDSLEHKIWWCDKHDACGNVKEHMVFQFCYKLQVLHFLAWNRQ